MKLEDKLTTTIMILQVALNNVDSLKHTNYYQKEIKKHINLLLPHLIKSEKEYFDKFFKFEEKSTDYVYQVHETFLKELANVPIYDMENIVTIIKAYNKDKKSIEGICNKVLR